VAGEGYAGGDLAAFVDDGGADPSLSIFSHGSGTHLLKDRERPHNHASGQGLHPETRYDSRNLPLGGEPVRLVRYRGDGYCERLVAEAAGSRFQAGASLPSGPGPSRIYRAASKWAFRQSVCMIKD
jgi:hypothetical protein